mmetsp:Transcript_29116/g.54513  ORF Transcript_29116/g.54513 Transcript_29116/m.54513 type:complete len:81 (-) Transcript_29116:239-481(-)
MKVMEMKLNQPMSQAEITRAFSMLQDEKTSKISLADLRKVAKEVGEDLDDEELLQMMKGAGATSIGDSIDFQQFASIVSE